MPGANADAISSRCQSPNEGYKIAAIIDRQRVAIESADLEARIARLEGMVVEEGGQ